MYETSTSHCSPTFSISLISAVSFCCTSRLRHRAHSVTKPTRAVVYFFNFYVFLYIFIYTLSKQP